VNLSVVYATNAKVYSGHLCPTASTAPKGEAKKLASQRATEEQQFAGNADFSEMPVINELTFTVAYVVNMFFDLLL